MKLAAAARLRRTRNPSAGSTSGSFASRAARRAALPRSLSRSAGSRVMTAATVECKRGWD